MTVRVWFSALGLLAGLCCFILGPAEGGKVLVFPVDGSHWLSMKILVKELTHRGHDVVVLVPESGMLMENSEGYRTQFFQVPYNKSELDRSFKQLQGSVFVKAPAFTDLFFNVELLVNFTTFQAKGCRSLLSQPSLMSQLRDEGFDLVLTDPFLPCGSILARIFGIPAVYFLRGLPCDLDSKANRCPVPLSYVPRFYSGNTDVMTFPQRVKNNLMGLVESYLCGLMYAHFDDLASEFVEEGMTYKKLLSHGAIWLLRYDFVFEWPKPMLPNMFLIGGINCAREKPLPADLEEFVEGSGEDGFIVFTLGSMVSNMPEQKALQFLDAFRQIPQRVLWRYTGVPLKNVPKNVKLMKWLPQNDLLAHPKAKLFLTHGGTHGIYESLCNGVPMLMLPLFGDQVDNVHRMVVRGVAERLSMHDVTTEKLLVALDNVINNKRYKEKMEKLSAIHLDRPIPPLDLAVFWTEFVMRHKGAAHLRVAAHELNWFQYHSLDVIGFLLAVVATTLYVTLRCCLFFTRKVCTKVTVKRKSE
ncbi:UDP-glucuronosyltransferase-like [Corythoichthys intestinalis]|uniref:UDP-glucuronosyltransferase-like n=1 Tax=Corythoichthys intestinalis TaxID=161448 RepID=UPI0025A59288|nr:UDP-glucuronosyltransferase-like [Corythoichthys intestinalis]XP_057709188.1 UDP-glucuronosyltransferase-like [Corythoichthys intestinalis]XP_061799186.1 UDP-glucuronosyltransferase-like [Nerophis lumbriciformis]